MATMAPASTNSVMAPLLLYSCKPMTNDMAAATIRMMTTKLLNCASNICQNPGRGCSINSLRP